jgi:hypothetical protein
MYRCPSWRVPTRGEYLAYIQKLGARSKGKRRRRRPAVLVVRQHLTPVDMYCYLKARFGKPNGFQEALRKNDSDNWIHWHFQLKASDEDVVVFGTSREVHFALSERMTDEDWRDLILAIKADYKRVGGEKATVLKSLERWVIFPNKFIELADICADLHANILDNIGGF